MITAFKNSHDVLTFALGYSSTQFGHSPVAKLQPGTIGSGKGLVGENGAGEAGMVLAILKEMSPLHAHCIIARNSPKHTECKCCGGKKPIAQWQESIKVLSEWSMSACTGISHARVREAIILNFYDRGVSITEVAKDVRTAVKTAYNQRTKIHAALRLLDDAAQSDIEDRLEKNKLISA